MSELKSKHLFDLTIQLHPILDLGATPAGERRIVPVSGGQFTGERLHGEVLSHAGSDLLLTRAKIFLAQYNRFGSHWRESVRWRAVPSL